MSSQHVFSAVIVWLLAATFIWAIATKLAALSDFRAFTLAIAPKWLGKPRMLVPTILLSLEALTVISLLVRPRVGAGLAIAILVAFSLVAEGVRLSGVRIRCACFGSGGGLLGRETAIRNLALTSVAVPVLVYPPSSSVLGDYRVIAAAATLLVALRTLAGGLAMAREIERGLFSS